ncbi:MAG: hypothetical protein ACYCWE_01995 [Eubacteriales bacterium]
MQANAYLSLQTIYRARFHLLKNGYITYNPGSGVQCGTYLLTDLTVNYNTHRDILPENRSDMQPQSDNPYGNPYDNPYDNPYGNPYGNPCDTLYDKQVALQTITLTKQNRNKTKQNKMELFEFQTDSLCEKENLFFFDAFRKAYPKKQAKADALRAFLKLSPDKELLKPCNAAAFHLEFHLDRMLEAIKLFSHTNSWKRGNVQYIPLPATWLNGKR